MRTIRGYFIEFRVTLHVISVTYAIAPYDELLAQKFGTCKKTMQRHTDLNGSENLLNSSWNLLPYHITRREKPTIHRHIALYLQPSISMHAYPSRRPYFCGAANK